MRRAPTTARSPRRWGSAGATSRRSSATSSTVHVTSSIVNSMIGSSRRSTLEARMASRRSIDQRRLVSRPCSTTPRRRGSGSPAWASATPDRGFATSATSPSAWRSDVVVAAARRPAPRAPAPLPRPRHGALTNLERFVAGVPDPDATLSQLADERPDDRDPRPALQHQPVFQRADDPRPRAARLAPRGRRAARPRRARSTTSGTSSRAPRPRRPSGWRSAGSASARCSGSATTTSSAASRSR